MIIGVGNTLRSDDGAGAYVCDVIEQLKIENVFILKAQQLQTEIITALFHYDKIIIVDASVTATEVILKKSDESLDTPMSSSHHTHPAALYSLAKQLYKKELNLYTCAIPVKNFEMGEGLSVFAKMNADEALQQIIKWLGMF